MRFDLRKTKGSERSPVKVCLKCRVEKNVYNDFHWSRCDGKEWPNGRCKKCVAERLIEYRSTRRDKYNEYARNARVKNPEKYREISIRSNAKDGGKRKRQYLESLKTKSLPVEKTCRDCSVVKNTRDDFFRNEQPCKKCRLKRSTLQRKTDQGRIMRKAEYENHKEEAKSRARDWRSKNPDRVRELKRAYLKTDKCKKAMRDKERRRRAAMFNANIDGPPVTSDWFASVKSAQNHSCYYCKSVLPLEMDHVKALNAGGLHVRENILPACRSCNSSKGDRGISEWRPWIDIPLYGLELASG